VDFIPAAGLKVNTDIMCQFLL